jgi:diacylglycerol kinase (ATP)
MHKTLYVINPAGRGGAGVKVWERVQSTWSDRIASEDAHVTERQGHAREIAAAAEGYDILAAIGGDGTVGEVMTGVMSQPEPHPRIAIIPAGTGNDIARNLGILSFEDAVDALHGDHSRSVDLIRIECQVEGSTAHRYAFLTANAGFSANTMIRPWMKRILGPAGAYYLATILQIVTYRAPHIAARWEEHEYSGEAWMVIVANVERTSGGSMCLAPGAQFDDGELNVSIIPFQSKLREVATMLPKVASGGHIEEPSVMYFPTKGIAVESDPPVVIDIDGDIFGMTPATFAVCPRAVQVLCPERADNHVV